MKSLKKNKLIKRFKKIFKKKKFFRVFKKKFKKSFLKKINLQKKKEGRSKKKQRDNLYLGIVSFGFFVLLVLLFSQVYFLTKDLIYLESLEESKKIKEEILLIENHINLTKNDFSAFSYPVYNWRQEENKKILSEKVRHLDYLNDHLLKVIYSYENDLSLQFYKNSQGNLESIFKEARNSQLISSRIANKINTLILFDKLTQDQIDILDKDFELIEEKIELIKSF